MPCEVLSRIGDETVAGLFLALFRHVLRMSFRRQLLKPLATPNGR
jgi:hypothetical protein